ncbi:MAG: YegP family protein [bacterium]|nr:YegP family protein [bacterium]
MGKFVISPAKSGIKFNLKASNGEIVAASQVYASKKTCKIGINSVIANAPIAALEDQTEEGYAIEKHPKFELYVDKAGEFRFRLKAKNGQIVAVSESYKAKKSALNGIESVRKNAAEGNIVEEGF